MVLYKKTLSRFKMTHEEIVRRRTMKRERILREMSPLSRKTVNERPPSIAHKSPKDLLKNTKKDTTKDLQRDRSKSKVFN